MGDRAYRCGCQERAGFDNEGDRYLSSDSSRFLKEAYNDAVSLGGWDVFGGLMRKKL